MELEPIGMNAQRQHQEIIKENIGKSKARIELVVRSSKMNGKKYIIARRLGRINRFEGAALLLVYVGYTAWLICTVLVVKA